MLPWLPWKPPGCQMSTLKINFRHPPTQSNQETLWTKMCTQMTPGTVLFVQNGV